MAQYLIYMTKWFVINGMQTVSGRVLGSFKKVWKKCFITKSNERNCELVKHTQEVLHDKPSAASNLTGAKCKFVDLKETSGF